MVDVISGFAGIKAAYELAKTVKVGVDKFDDAQVKMQMAELVQALADATIDASEKATKIHELEQRLSMKESMIYEEPYYKHKHVDGTRDGPFCQKCYDSDQKPIRLQKVVKGQWRCLTCLHVFEDGDYDSSSMYDESENGGGSYFV